MASFGYLTLALAFLLAVYGLVMAMWGMVQKSDPSIESARLALFLIFPLVSASLIVIIIMLLDNRFDVAYVYSVTSRDMPGYLKLTALWGGQSGSLLFWSWLLAGFSMVFSARKWHQERDLLPWALIVVFIILGFFLSLNVFMESPFERFWHLPNGVRVLSVFQPAGGWALIPQDGQGLNPLLRHPGMIWHPPALYLGFVGFAIPFALAVASLAAGRKDDRWLVISRSWVLVSWVFLTLGLVLGMRWAYDVLGWGGYWGWDPVEIAALMPWLSATAFLHTALLQRTLLRQRKDGFRRWNLVLIIITFVLVIFGTFLTRSGVLSSVHSFAGSEIGLPMFIFTALLTLASLGWLFVRWQSLKSEHETDFALSREVLTLFTNLVLLSILLVCFLGVVYPIFSDLLTGVQVTVGPAWYERITGPLFILLLILMGICPLAAWSGTKASAFGKRWWMLILVSLLVPMLFWVLADVRSAYVLGALWVASLAVLVNLSVYAEGVRHSLRRSEGRKIAALWEPFACNHQKYGGFLVHLGIILMGIGIIGIEGLQQETQVTLAQGERVLLGNYEFRYEGLDVYDESESIEITEALLSITRDGKPVGALYPQRQVFWSMGLAITQPSVRPNLARDLYAILVDWQPTPENSATFRIFINPLVSWLWIGTGVLTVGVIVAVLPERNKRTSAAVSSPLHKSGR